MTGAGSKNTNITNYLYEFARDKNMEIDITTGPQPEIAIIKGDVLFGLQNGIIRKRRSKYTIGIKNSNKWDEELHKNGGIKKEDYDDFQARCCNLFSKFITRNQYLDYDQVISREYNSIYPNPKIVFYKTLKEDCTFIDEKDENNNLIINTFGDIQLNIKDYDKNNSLIRIDMKLGGTYVYMSAVYLKTGKKIDQAVQTFS